MARIKLKPNEFDPLTAHWSAWLSGLAYAKPSKIINNCKLVGLPNVKPYSKNGTRCFLASNDKACVVSWAGTNPRDLRNLITDFRIKKKPGPFGQGDKTHGGFTDYVDELRYEVNCDLPEFTKDGELDRFDMGHSLGACASAIFTAHSFENKTFCPRGIYLFGCPNPGNRPFSTIYDHEANGVLWIYTNHNDHFARVPWLLSRMGSYWRIGKKSRQYFSGEGERWENPGRLRVMWDRWQGTNNSVWRWATDGVSDHDFQHYVNLTRADLPTNLLAEVP